MACNGLFGVGEGTMISPPSSSRYFDLSMAEITVFNRDCYQLILDLTMLIGMAQVSACENMFVRRHSSDRGLIPLFKLFWKTLTCCLDELSIVPVLANAQSVQNVSVI